MRILISVLQRNNQPLAAAPAGRPTNDQVTVVSAVFIPTFSFLAVYKALISRFCPFLVLWTQIQDFDNLRIKSRWKKFRFWVKSNEVVTEFLL